MSDQDQQLGYLCAKVEEIHTDIRQMDARIKKVEEEISVYKTAIKFFKLLATTVIFVVAFKLGDIKTLWGNFFS